MIIFYPGTSPKWLIDWTSTVIYLSWNRWCPKRWVFSRYLSLIHGSCYLDAKLEIGNWPLCKNETFGSVRMSGVTCVKLDSHILFTGTIITCQSKAALLKAGTKNSFTREAKDNEYYLNIGWSCTSEHHCTAGDVRFRPLEIVIKKHTVCPRPSRTLPSSCDIWAVIF